MHLPLRTKVSIALSLLVVLALSLGLIVSGRDAAHANGGSITLSPTVGHPTTSVTINGIRIGYSETVNNDTDSN